MNQKLSVIFPTALIAVTLSIPSTFASQPSGESPMLVVTDQNYANNKYGNYLAEMLKSEGLMEFEQVHRNSFATISPSLLQCYDTIYLAEMNLSTVDEQLLRGYVSAGGNLIAMRPDTDLMDLFGITVDGTRTEKYLQYFGVSQNLPTIHDFPQGMGIVQESVQYHGEATNYQPAGSQTIASLYTDAQTPSQNPAVTINKYGQGNAVAFAFDLAKSVTLSRQGNPAWQNTEGDGLSGYRPTDMFMRTDGTKYYDPNKLSIPQADEAQRLLSNIAVKLANQPLPRMWYLPGRNKCLMVNTGDAENNYGSELDPAFSDCASYGGHFTAYLRNGNRGIEKTTVEQESAWRSAGHEIGVHMYGNGAEGAGAEEALNVAYQTIVTQLQNKFGHGSRTARNHSLDWTGWVTMAAIEASHGTSMDMNYYQSSAIESPGYVTGSGLPQHFIDSTGQILPIYQAATQWPDEWFDGKGYSISQVVNTITDMFEAAEENGFYSAFVANMHQVRYNGSDNITPFWPKMVWQYCQEHAIPSWSAEMLLDFAQVRNASQFKNLEWFIDENTNSGILDFDFITSAKGQNLTIMLPFRCDNRSLTQVIAGGELIEPVVEEIKGIEYAMFSTQEDFLPVKAIYTVPEPGPSTVGYWRFEDSGNLGADSGPNNLDLTTSGAADYYVLPETGRGSAIDDPVPQTGANNDAAADLTGGYFHRADDPAFTLSDFTVEAYISIDERGKYHHIAGQYATTDDQRSWIFGITDKEEVYFGVSDDGTYDAYQSHRGATLLPGHDYYLAVSFDLSADIEGVKFYSKNLTLGDDLEVITRNHAQTAVFDASCDFEVGAYREGTLPLDGLLDELRISNTVLSESELLVNISGSVLEGDLNSDGFVGGDDLDIVRSFWGQTVTSGDLLSGDPSNDGFVGGDDLDIVRANWGQGTPPAPSAVPEPSTAILLILGSFGLWLWRRV